MASPAMREFEEALAAEAGPSTTMAEFEAALAAEASRASQPGAMAEFEAALAAEAARPGPARIPPAVGAAYDERDRLRRTLATEAEKALYRTLPGETVPPATRSADVRSALTEAHRRGLLPEKLTPRRAADAWRRAGREEAAADLEEPSWSDRITSFLGSIPETALAVGLVGAGKGRLLASAAGGRKAKELAESVMGRGKAVPSSGRTVHRPTVLSTTFDALGLPQRVLVTAPVEIAVGDRPDEAWWQTLGHAFKLPSWTPGPPRDNAMFVRRTFRDMGWDPDSWWGLANQMAAALADPVMFVGGPGRTTVEQAGVQALRVAERSLRSIGQRGQPLRQSLSSMVPRVAETIREAGTLGRARPRVREMLAEEVGDHAAAMFDRVGLAWGEPGVSLGIPLLRGRERHRLSGVWEPAPLRAESLHAARAKVRDAVARLPGGRQVQEILAAGRRVFDPSAPPKGADDPVAWRDYYEERALLALAPEHEHAVRTADVEAASRLYTSLPDRATRAARRRNPVLLGTEELASWSDNPRLAAAAERQYAMAALNHPMRSSTERWAPNQYAEAAGVTADGTLLPDPALTGGPLDYQSEAAHVIRQGYASAVIRARRTGDVDEAAEAFGEYVVSGLRDKGWAADAADAVAMDLVPRVRGGPAGRGPLWDDAAAYHDVMEGLDARMRHLVELHSGTTADLRAAERKLVLPFAKTRARRAAAEAREAALADGLPDDRRRAKVREAARKAFAEVMGRVGGDVDNHFTHILRDRDAVMVRHPHDAGTSSPSGRARRQFVDVIENWEHGQDPVTDLLVTTAARVDAHRWFRARHEAMRALTSDRRWAVPAGESGGLRAKDGWARWTHPYTGEELTVRQEVARDFDRVVEGYRPGGIDAVLRAITEKAPWLGTIGSGWKARVTHGRLLFYNARNLPDDAWRMWMGGYDGSPETARQALMVALVGHIEEGAGARRGLVRAARRSGRLNADRMQDAFDAKIREMVDNPTNALVQRGTGARADMREAYRQAARYGIVDKSFVGVELSTPAAVQGTKGRRWSPLDLGLKDMNPVHREHAVFGEGGFYLRFTGSASRKAENLRRLTSFVDGWKRGETWESAARNTHRWQFNYNEIPDAMRRWLRPLIPFVTFTSKAIPAHFRAMRRHPGRYMAVERARRVAEEHAEAELGPAPVVPDYIDDQWAVRIPRRSRLGSDLFMSVGLSASEVNAINPARALSPGRGGLYDDVSPVYDLAALMMTGRDPRTGRLLSDTWREPDASLLAVVDAWNRYPGVTRALRVPHVTRRRPDGTTYKLLPADLVWGWDKWLPNLVSVTKAISPRRDPFSEERQPYDKRKQVSGVSTYVVNPIVQESHAIRRTLDVVQPTTRGAEE